MAVDIVVSDELISVDPDEPDFSQVEDHGKHQLLVNGLRNKHKLHVTVKKSLHWIGGLGLIEN